MMVSMEGTPDRLRNAQAADFVARSIGPEPRILDVGCGRGEVARQLGAIGCRVTALDVKLRDPVPGPNVEFIEHDFLAYEAEPFDVLLFTASLHHIAPLDQAIAHAAKLLVSGGRLIVDDFDVAAPDHETLTWYYEQQELLAAAELYPAERIDPPAADPTARWQAAHHHEPALHTGAAMRSQISSSFVIRNLQRADYLFRYITAGLPADERGARIANHVRTVERTRIANGTLVPVGLRIVADRPNV